MASTDRISIPLQESVLTLIATNDNEGRIASGMLTYRDFDDNYRDIVARIQKFRKRHGKAPGVEHLSDLMDDVIGNVGNKRYKQYMRTLQGIVELSENLNASYVLSRVEEFSKRQRIKTALIQASELYQHGGEGFIDNVEDTLRAALKPMPDTMDAGTFFNDKVRALGFLDRIHNNYRTGIPEFDMRGLGPTPGEMFMFMAPKGEGKSWFAIQMGRECLMQKAKVLHVTLEMSEDRVAQRYFQNFFALGKRTETFYVHEFVKDELNRIGDIKKRRYKIKMSLEDPNIQPYLLRKMKTWGTRLERLVIKGFPAKSLTISKLEAYIDMLEMQHKFIPNVLIVDYPDLLYMDKKDPRISLGWTIEELRGLFQRRNLAGICPTQTNRSGWDATTVKGSMVAEDASKFKTADMIVIQSRTKQEKAMGLARLYVEKNRDDEDGYTVAITQNYKTGQYVLQSNRMDNTYYDLLKTRGARE